MLSSTADYALRAVLFLGASYGKDPVRADEIANATGAPHNYLAKTLNALAKSGVVASSRGPAGGFTLAVDPADLVLARIIDLFDEPKPHSQCLLGIKPCDPQSPCAAHARWTEIVRGARAPLTSTTVADLLGAA